MLAAPDGLCLLDGLIGQANLTERPLSDLAENEAFFLSTRAARRKRMGSEEHEKRKFELCLRQGSMRASR
jgi:hypothetical protein